MKKLFWPLIFLYYIFLYAYGVNFLSFSIFEAESVDKFWLLKTIFEYIPKNDYVLRLIPLIFSFFSFILYLKISKFYLKEKYLYFSSLTFLFLPGFLISSIILNKAIFLIFETLLFIYLYKRKEILGYIFLALIVFSDYSLVALYFSLIFYAGYKKDVKLLFYIIFLFAINANYFDYVIKGKPRGFFIDVFGTYFLIFSPFVFVYFLYTIYKGFFYKKDVIFFIGVGSFLISLLLSFRQRIKIDDFAPFVLPYTIYMHKIFLSSYKVRLKKFRWPYKLLFVFLFSSMIIFDFFFLFSNEKLVYNLKKDFYFIRPLALFLKNHHIDKVSCNNKFLCRALNFYGINSGDRFYIKYSKSKNRVSIFHNKKELYNISVSKLNTFKVLKNYK